LNVEKTNVARFTRTKLDSTHWS